MVDYREILRMKDLNYSQRQIEASVKSSRHTIRDVLEAAQRAGVNWPLDADVTNEQLQAVLFPGKTPCASGRVEPDYGNIHRELAKPGVNLTLLWNEYSEQSRISEGVPYMYTQSCDKYRRWARLTKATMRIAHKPGEAMQVDWAGNTIPIFDSVTGEESKAYLFVAVLPCSGYAYVDACLDMRTKNWLLCHAQAYKYYGGVTRLLIPDNLKTGIKANTRYETVLNRSYQELAEHYDTAIVPARVRHPQDKSLVEGTVKYASTWIIAALRDQRFFSLDEVRQAIREKLEALNDYAFKRREGCRRSAYFMEEREYMKPLPATPYEPTIWLQALVGSDYLISDGTNKYSVPYDLIGEEVNIRLTGRIVEVFYHGSRVAVHVREAAMRRDPLVKPEHMTPEHRKYLNYNAEDFQAWANSIGGKTAAVVHFFLTRGKEPEQGYKACASLSKLFGRYGAKRLEAACERAMAHTAVPTVRNISAILKNGQDRASVTADAQASEPSSCYGITRGADYFSKGGESE